MVAPPLHTTHIDSLVLLHRLHILLYASVLLLLFLFHVLTLLYSPSLPAAALFVSDLVLAFLWVLCQAFRWRPLHRREHPERLQAPAAGLPSLDVFVCTADPYREPPAGVASTVLSAMGFDYPAEKLSVYVSDDGGSELTLYALVEAARFARSWLPFCREYGVDERSPEVFFRRGYCGPGCEEMKLLYQRMKEKLDNAVERGHLNDDDLLSMEKYGHLQAFKKWATSGFQPTDHPSIIEVLLDCSTDKDTSGSPMPNLVYLSREKSRNAPHHFKAGALNALLRVSNVMTNGEVILTLDCDTASNDPSAPRRALCYLLDDTFNSDLAFVQFPQRFSGLNQDDTYAGTYTGLFHMNPPGMDGLRGPNYVGSGTFFARRALHAGLHDPISNAQSTPRIISENVLERANQVAGCRWEDKTKWGSATGFRYGSLVEDYYTGLLLHSEGWKSVYCNPRRAAFLGEAPITLHDSMSQVRRWVVGLLEVAISGHCPLLLCLKNNTFTLMGMCYAHYAFWPFWFIPILTYATLPPVALFYQRPLFPKANDPWILVYAYLFVAAYAKDLLDFLRAGGTCRRWWNDQRMWMIRGLTAFPLGSIEYLLKHLGFPGLGFNVTSKVTNGEQHERYLEGVFELGPSSPFLISIGTVATVNLVALVVGSKRAIGAGTEGVGSSLLQLFLCGFAVVNCLPIYEAMALRKDGGRMEMDCVAKCFLLSGLLFAIGWYLLVS